MSSILVVESNEHFLQLTEELLRSSGGHHVICARNGHDALNILATSKDIEVVLSDTHLEMSMNGLEMIAKIDKLGYDVDIVLMSGFMDKSIEHQGQNVGAQHVIHKIGIAEHLERIGLIRGQAPKSSDI